ncbi:hypothetical protein Angca_001955, partial [Angiostrongylus cantonensis]
STANVKVKFDENDMRELDDTEGTDMSIFHQFARMSPLLAGSISTFFNAFLYEWQRMHSTKLTRNPRASFNFKNLLEKDKNYIPFYTLSWLFGEKYKAFIISCTGVEDDRTADEPEAVSPRRESARESMLKR